MSSRAAHENTASHAPFRALFTYFALAFLIPWGVVLTIVAMRNRLDGLRDRGASGAPQHLDVGLLLGPIHGVWHLAAGYWSKGAIYGGYFVPHFLVAWIAGLTVLRMLIVWLYRRTGSLLLAALTHASYTGSLLMLWPTETLPLQNIAWTSCFVLLLGTAVTVLLHRDSRRTAGNGA